MPNDRNDSNFWKNVATGVGVAAVGAALAYYVNELFTEENQHSEERPDWRDVHLHPRLVRTRKNRVKSSPELRNSLIDQLNSGTYECNICLDEVSRNDKIVSCKKCYTINHLKCIEKHCETQWSQNSSNTPECPTCRSYINYSLDYYCFCGNQNNPRSRPGLTPHCCRSMCSYSSCNLKCHPGPCGSTD